MLLFSPWYQSECRAMISSAALLFSCCKTFVGRQQRNTSVYRNLSSLLNTSTSVCFSVCQWPVFMFPRWWFLSFSGSEPHARRLDDCQQLPVWSSGRSLPTADWSRLVFSSHGSPLPPTHWCWRQQRPHQTMCDADAVHRFTTDSRTLFYPLWRNKGVQLVKKRSTIVDTLPNLISNQLKAANDIKTERNTT